MVHRGVDLTARASPQEFFPCYFNGIGPVLPIYGIKSVSPLPIPVKFLPQSPQNMRNSFTTGGKSDLLTPTIFQSFTDGISQMC